jgi:hypothetical protein
VGGAGERARLYLNRDGELEFTRNACWDTALSKWRADVWAPGPAWGCSRLVLASTGPAVYAHGDPTIDLRDAAHAWPTAAWRRVTQLGQDGAVEFFATTTTASGSNPPADEPQTNRLVAKNTCKAWGSRVRVGPSRPPASARVC